MPYVCCLLGATRRSLLISAAAIGFVIGPIEIKVEGEDRILNLMEIDYLGKIISPKMPDFKVISCKANCIIVVEKETYYELLVERRFHENLNCILLTGKGMPNFATRFFLRKLTEQVNIPIFGLVDGDKSGLEILCCYSCGSDSAAFDSDNLVTPGIKWLGPRPSEVVKYNLDTEVVKQSEKKGIANLMSKAFIKDKDSWLKELVLMLSTSKKCDLHSLSYEMVKMKLENNEWLDNVVQFGSKIRPKGVKYRLDLRNQKDARKMLNLQVVKSKTATIKIPELKVEIFPNAQRDSLSTVEDILLRNSNELEALQAVRKKLDPQNAEAAIDQFILKLKACATGSSSFTFILDDPAGNSFIERPHAIAKPFKFEVYERTRDAQASLGYPIDPTQWSEKDMTFDSTCVVCAGNCVTQLFVTHIPYFKEVIFMSSTCDACGYHNSELKAGGAIPPKGKKVSVIVKDTSDLNRVVIMSDTASVIIPDLELELPSGMLLGAVTTVEGLVMKITEALKRVKCIRDRVEHDWDSFEKHWDSYEKFKDFIARLDEISRVEYPWTLIINDALGNSSIASACDCIKDDQQLTIEEYERSTEQEEEEYGLNDIDQLLG